MLSLALMLGLSAIAAPPPSAEAGPLAALDACRAVPADAERLACFDRAAKAIADARASRAIVVMDKGEVQRARRGLFGFSLPSLKLFGGDDDEPALRELDTTIRGVAPYGYGYFSLTLADGSEWQTTDRIRSFTPRAGDAIKIRRGALGYRATSRGALVQVRRVR